MLAGLPSASADNTVPAYLNSDSKFSLVADLALVKTVNDNTPDPNQVITFTLVVSNAGPNPATSVTIRDVVPAGLTFVVGSQTGPGTYNSSNPPVTGVNWQNVFIANGGSVVLGFQATVTAAGGSVITNFAEVTSSVEVDPDSTPNNGNIGEDDGDTEMVTVNNPIPPVVLTCPVNTTTAACQTQAAVNSAFATWLATASGTGGCNGVLTNNNTGAPAACGGSTTVTFTYTSTCAPLTTTCQATFTVAAAPTPNLSLIVGTTIISACQTQAAVDASYATWLSNNVQASGGCNGVLTNNSTGAPSACGGSITVIWTYTTSCAAPITTQGTFTVTAAPPPSLTCPSPLTRPVCQTRAQDSIAMQNWLNTSSFSGGCNGSISYNGFTGNPPSSCGGTKTLTLTYTSSCAAPLNCTSTFTIPAPTAPVLTCPSNQNEAFGQTQAQINAAFATWLATASGSGGCNGVLSNNNIGAPPATGGSTTVTFTYAQNPPSTPFSGACPFSTLTCQATFAVSATPPVVLTCPTNTTTAACQTQAAVNAAFATWLATASGTGGCNGVLTNNNTGAPPACGGSTTVTFTYTSTCAPLTTTCQATFTVAAPPPVTIICPVPTTVASCQSQAAINAQYAAWLATFNGQGGCNLTGSDNGNFPPSNCGEAKTVTFTLTSTCAPLTTSCQSTFTVTTPPPVVLTCPVNTTTASCQTQAAVNTAFATWLATASASGGCNGVLTNNNTGAPPACGGSTTVTFTYTSSCAPLTTTCQATFTVAAAPTVVLTCPVNTTTAACQTQAAVNTAFATWLATASASGGCNGVLTNNNTGAPSACGGSTTVTFTYTSACAPLTTTCQATFTVASSPVVLTCPTNTTAAACQTQAAINTAFATWLATASASGGCNGVLTNNNTGAPSACGGSTTVTFTYTSTCAPLTTTCQATFTVPAAPTVVLTCPTNTTAAACQTQAAVNTAFATWLATASASGGCNGVLTNNNTGAPPACGGSTTVTFTYTSSCAPTTTTCQATFTVAAAPTVVLTCPTNTTAAACQTQAAVNTAFATWLATASANGGCNGVLTNNNTGAPPACGGSTTVTFTYTSSCAPTTTTCQATFMVSAAPTVVLTCPTNTTAAACQSQAAVNTAFATWLATASASGGCNGVLTNNNTGAPSACGGSTTVTFTYTSSCAPTTTTCQATFTVAAAPTVVLTCPVNTTTAACQTQAAVNTAFATWLATASASGGCNGVLTNNNTGAPPACGGSTTVTFTYTSSCAPTTTTCQAIFTVAAAPTVVLTCPINTTVAACQTQAAVNAQFNAWLASVSGSGGCNGVLTNNNTGAPSSCGGSTTVTFTYTSSCAPTTTTCQATFTVAAAPPVVLTCPTPTTASACLTQSQLDAAYNAWLASATASGGCNGVLTNNSPGAPSICSATAVVRTVVFTYTSSCAPTTTTCTSTFTVPAYPTFTVPANGASTVACPALIVQPTPPVVVDGCGKTLTPTGPAITNAPNPITCEGTRTFVWTYTDCAGHVLTWSHVTTVERQPFTVPANGAATVACPANATQPVPPTVTSNCGEVLTPTGPVITNNPNPLTCEGTRTYTWTYTDCEGNTATWSFVYTVERQPFGVPGNVNATVACPDDTDVVPTPPVVTSNCGEVLTPVISSTPKNGCEGERVYTFHYTDCEGNTADWQFIYHVEYLDFIIPSSETVSVECPLNASQPVPPVVYDNCSRLLNPTGPVITSTNNASGCEGSRTYAWTYKDCEGNTHVWSKTFVFLYTSDFFVYPDGEDFVGCLLYAQPPVPPTIYDYCGNEIIPTGPVVTGDSDGCSGTRKFTYTYKDCGGHSHNWNYTYHANDNEPPVGNCPSGSLFNVDVTNLNCIEEVPCPDNYDFSSKIVELLDAGNIYDLCSGDDIIVELDSWSELWECSDPEGDGTFTFGRTFYFRIADQCGNEMSSLCPVTYSGSCLPIQTFTQSDWGNEGGEPGSEAPNTPTDLQLITTLLNQGPLVIGGSHRSLTLTSAQCLMSLVPGAGGPTKLGNCHQVNCSPACNPAGTIGMKNSLATNTISLILNMRYNVQFNGLTMAQILGQGLGCVSIDPNIKVCSESGGCKLHLFESNGTEHVFPYTFGGLLDLANLFLDGNLTLTNGQSSLYANAINNAISNVNAYWNGLPPTITCDPNAGVAPFVGDTDTDKSADKSSPKETVEFDLAPNPSSGEVVFSLPKLEESKPVTLEIYSAFGKPVFHKEYGNVSFVRDRIHLNNVGSGLYLVTVKAGGARSVQKFYISKD